MTSFDQVSSPAANDAAAMARNMVEQQIRPWDVNSPVVLDALENIRREDFVPQAYADNAFSDIQIPLGHGHMLEPKLAARMIQALDVEPEQRVLQIGIGAGYCSALLSRMASQVQVVVEDKHCLDLAQRNLAMAGISNVLVEQGDAANGWASAGEVDAILIHGAVESVSDALFEQLSQGGHLVAVVGTNAPMELMRYTKQGDEIIEKSLVDTVVPSLKSVPQKAFEF